MEINNDRDLARAADEASALLQAIQDYLGRKPHEAARVRFPRGYLRTASTLRKRFDFIENKELKSNLAYTLILSDVILWVLHRTDIAGTARDMLIKLFLFLGGTLIESITKDYLKGICGKNFKGRTQYLKDQGIIDEQILNRPGFSRHAAVVDLFSRQVVGWSMGSRIDTGLVLDALLMALWRRRPKGPVLVHSDQGCQFTGHEWQAFLRDHNLVSSMSRRGNCHDNAVAESFFQLLKRERVRRQIYATRDQARADVFNYIEMFYNPRRRHGTAGAT